MHYLKHISSPLRAYAIMAVLFLFMIVFLPVSTIMLQSMNISVQQFRILLFLIELPLVAVWFTAFYASAKLQDYARTVTGTPEGQGFRYLALGSLWLAWGLALPQLVNLLLTGLTRSHGDTHHMVLIIVTYLRVIFPLIAFGYILKGSHHLVTTERLQPSLTHIRFTMAGYILVGVLFCFLVFSHLNSDNLWSADNPYHISLWQLVLTVIVPSLYAWFVGLLAARELTQLAGHVKGILYRQSLQQLAGGLVLVIAGSIGVQYLRSVTPRTGHFSLNMVVAVSYLIYAAISLGYILIILGARRLKKIEDV